MSCRCSDITRCRLDIELVSEMISITGKIDAKNDGSIDSSVKLIAEETGEAISPSNIESLCDGLLRMNKKMEIMTASVQFICDSGLKKLQTDLQLLEAEDEAYHAKEEE